MGETKEKKGYKITRDDIILAIVIIWSICMIAASIHEYSWIK